MKIKEKDISFEFNERYWSGVLKFDEETDYKNASNSLLGIKGVDFTGIYQNSTLVLIEVKDFRGYRIKNKPKFADGPESLWVKVAQKHTNSLSIMIGAARNSTHKKALFQSYLDILKNERKPILLILWLEEDSIPKGNTSLKPDRHEHAVLQSLKKGLKWLTTKIMVVDKTTNPFPQALTVSYL